MESSSWLHKGPRKNKTLSLNYSPNASWTLIAWDHDHHSGEPIPVLNHTLVKSLLLIPNLTLPCCSSMLFPQVLLQSPESRDEFSLSSWWSCRPPWGLLSISFSQGWKKQGTATAPHTSCPLHPSSSQLSFECSLIVLCPSYIVEPKLVHRVQSEAAWAQCRAGQSPHPAGLVRSWVQYQHQLVDQTKRLFNSLYYCLPNKPEIIPFSTVHLSPTTDLNMKF